MKKTERQRKFKYFTPNLHIAKFSEKCLNDTVKTSIFKY